DGCSLAALYAATYPERTRAIALFHPVARPAEQGDLDAELAELRDRWGTQAYCDLILGLNAPSLLESEKGRRFFANWLRVGASPASAYIQNRAFAETDLSDVLPAVRVPALVLYRPKSVLEPGTREVARLIPGANLVAASGSEASLICLSPEIPDEL